MAIRLIDDLFFGVIGFSNLRLNSNGGITTLIKFGLISYRPYNGTRRETDSGRSSSGGSNEDLQHQM